MKKLLIAILFVCSNVQAEQYDSVGAGTLRCFEYLEVPTGGQMDNMYISWAQGATTMYLSVNGLSTTKELLDSDFLRAKLNHYCEQKPEQMFGIAVAQYIAYIQARMIGA